MKNSLVGSSAPKLSNRLRGRQIPHIGVLNRKELEEVIALGEWFSREPL